MHFHLLKTPQHVFRYEECDGVCYFSVYESRLGLHYKMYRLIEDCPAVEDVEGLYFVTLFLYCSLIDHFVLAI